MARMARASQNLESRPVELCRPTSEGYKSADFAGVARGAPDPPDHGVLMRRARTLLPVRHAHLLRLGVPAALIAATLVALTGSSGSADVSAEPRPFKANFRPDR